jgi:hypothetical protein
LAYSQANADVKERREKREEIGELDSHASNKLGTNVYRVMGSYTK